MIIKKNVILSSIGAPIEGRLHVGEGDPWGIWRHGKPLNKRQQRLLDRLPGYDDRVIVKKSDVSMKDLAALTAKTGDEFAMFTCGSRRLIVRGNSWRVNINRNDAVALSVRGFKWSGHTHIHTPCASKGDNEVLKGFGQHSSVIYTINGKYNIFFQEED